MGPKRADDRKPSDEGKSAGGRPKRTWQDEPAGRFMDRDRARAEPQAFERVVWDEV